MIRCTHVLPLVIVAAVTLSPAAAGQTQERGLAPSMVVMEFPAAEGGLERPAVEFDHAAHTTALEREGCEACHSITDEGLSPRLTAIAADLDRDDLIDAYHDTCMGCHIKRASAAQKSGPVTCGECHVRRPSGSSLRVAMAFDYSLHGRHSKAFEDKCENCHHVYDEAIEKLKYEKGKEEACRSCHGAEDEERRLSLANASHRSCISCHLARIEDQLEAGPVRCVGCHEVARQLAIEKLDEPPRLMRGQPDATWIAAAEAKTAVVPFDHKAHESLTTSCSSCHHQTLKPCEDCHTLVGSEEGAGITMAQAYHLDSSEHSCVGCHSIKTASSDCAGCHRTLVHPPSEAACAVCHTGPRIGALSEDSPPPAFEEPRLAALPATSDDFPETVGINGLVDSYEQSNLPHSKIVGKLHEMVGESRLAARFHGDNETLCAGCHHYSPAGTRPPPCRSCHSENGDATRDKPGLKVAYHRQCMGCHIDMGLRQQGCTDCHAARAEVGS